MSFSIWFFTLLTMIQEGLFNRFGYAIAGRDIYTFGHPGIGWQGFGAHGAEVYRAIRILRVRYRFDLIESSLLDR